jgi:hypothetical protein
MARNWKKKWSVDLRRNIAHHDSGLSIEYRGAATYLAKHLPAGYHANGLPRLLQEGAEILALRRSEWSEKRLLALCAEIDVLPGARAGDLRLEFVTRYDDDPGAWQFVGDRETPPSQASRIFRDLSELGLLEATREFEEVDVYAIEPSEERLDALIGDITVDDPFAPDHHGGLVPTTREVLTWPVPLGKITLDALRECGVHKV